VRRATGVAGPPLLLTAVGLGLTQALSLYQEVTLTLWLAYGLLGLSLALAWGRGGIFSFGQTAFFGVAGYAFGVIAINLEPISHETLSALAGAALAGALLALGLGYFMFYGRVSDVYVAIITLAVTLVLLAVFTSTSGPQYRIGRAELGGYNGMTGIPGVELGLPGALSVALARDGTYVFVVVLCGLVYLALQVLLASPFGRVVAAVRENELRTELLGYDVRRYKLAVFTLAGAIAGLAGGVYAAWGGFLNPAPFSLAFAALVVIWVMVGGRTTLAGAFLGAVAVSGLSSYLGGVLPSQTTLVLGALLIAVVLLLPQGLVPAAGRALGRLLPPAPLVLAPGQPLKRSRAPRGLVVSEVVKRFGGVAALDGVSLTFEPNRLYCLIGPNGAGKSTLFNLLAGRARPNAGQVLHEGRPITRLAPHRRARRGIGIKLQVPAIYHRLTVHENVWLAAHARDARRADGLVTTVLAQLGLAERAGELAGELSHGEQQRLEIGMVLAAQPEIVLLDEPTAGMTREETLRMADLIKGLAAVATVVVVEHDMEFVARLDEAVTVLHEGRVFASGRYRELRQDPRVQDIYLGREARRAAS
jgi:branched-chain amino acid transport system permease protein